MIRRSARVAGQPEAQQTKAPSAAVPVGTTAGSNQNQAPSTVPSPALVNLLRIESEARRAPSLADLDGLFVNDARKLTRARQSVVIDLTGRGPKVVAISGLSVVDQTTPVVRWLEQIPITMAKEQSLDRSIEFDLPGYAPREEALTRDYPFRHFVWQPFWSSRGGVKCGSLLISDQPLSEGDRSIARRLGEAFGHARELLQASGSRAPVSWRRRNVTAAVAMALIFLGAVPVPMSVLAPLEIVPRDAEVVAAPVVGIVKKVLVSPNAAVKAGTPLIEFVDVEQKNRAAIAEQDVAVAAARAEKAISLAFSDVRGRQEMGLARAELALKKAEHIYARQLLEQTVIRAEREGIAVFSDRRDIEGRPVALGERLMLIAREADAEVRISLAVADSIVLRPGLRVQAFLDSDPLRPLGAKIAHVDYQARLDQSKVAAYALTARLDDERAAPSLGTRGTAQIIGERVPLFLYVLRRPLAALRQRLGL